MPTKGAELRSVSGINQGYSHTSQPCLVGHELSELIEGPVVMSSALSAANPCPLADSTQIFKCDPARGAFRGPDEDLADTVVDVSLETGEPARQLLESSLGTPGTDELKDGAALLIPLPLGFDLRTRELDAIGVSGNVNDTEIHTKPAIVVIRIGFINFADLVNIEVAVAEDQVCLAPQPFEHLHLVFASDEEKMFDSPTHSPDRNLEWVAVSVPAQDTLIIGNRTIRSECSLGSGVEFVGIGYLGDATHDNLRRKIGKLSSRIVVSQLVEIILPKCFSFPCAFAEIVACGISQFKRTPEGVGLFWRRKQFDLSDQFHGYII